MTIRNNYAMLYYNYNKERRYNNESKTEDGIINASKDTLRSIAVVYTEASIRYEDLGMYSLAKRSRTIYRQIANAIGMKQ